MLSQMPVASFQGQAFCELLRRQRMARRVYKVSERLLLSECRGSRPPRQAIPGAGNLLNRDRLSWEQVFGLISHLPPIPVLALTRCLSGRQQSPPPPGYHTTGVEEDLHWPVKGVFVG